MKNLRETLMHIVFFVCALASIAAVVLICLFLFANGIPAMKEIGLLNFLTGAKWKPGNDIYGILPMILGSIYITAGAVVIGVPVGLLTAIFMAFYCPKKLYGLLKPCTELLAGIPSIVYGLFGMLFFVNWAGWKLSLISGACTLAIMVLPTIMRTTEEALKSVPDSFREGSFGLGAGRLRTVSKIVLPSAVPGILAGVILAIGRIVGGIDLYGGDCARGTEQSVGLGSHAVCPYVCTFQRGTLYQSDLCYGSGPAGYRHRYQRTFGLFG